MKKTLSIILCLSLLMSTLAFAAPAEQIGVNQIGVEAEKEFGVSPEETESNEALSTNDFVLSGTAVTEPSVLTFSSGTGDDDSVTNLPEEIEEDGAVDLSTVEAPEREGYFFTGWTLDPADGTVVTSVDLSGGDKTLYATWASGHAWEFNTDGDTEGITCHANTTMEVKDGVLKLTDNGTDRIFLTGLNIDPAIYKKVVVSIKSEEWNVGALFFQSPSNPSYSGNGALYKSYNKKDDFQLVEYDFSDAKYAPYWKDKITAFRYDYATQNVGKIKEIDYIRVANNSIESFGVDGVEAPVAGQSVSAAANALNSAKYSVVGVTWEPAPFKDRYFDSDTNYTAKVELAPKAGYAFSETPLPATINGNTATVSPSGTQGNVILSYTFPKTEFLKETVVKITGSTEINRPGRYLELTASAKAADGSALPVKGVSWAIDDESVAKISQDGKVTPITDGVVTVTATSLYNPLSSAEHTITIKNQGDKHTVTFDKNTKVNIANVPAPAQAKGAYKVPDVVLQRDDGYTFIGWGTDKLSTSPVSELNVNSDITLYAIWIKGYAWEFNKESDITNFTVRNSTMEVADGVLKATNVAPNGDTSVTATRLSIDSAIYKKVVVRMKADMADTFQLFFTTTTDSGNDEKKSQRQSYASGDFQTIVFDFAGNAYWKDKITSLRFDYSQTKGANAEFDYIHVFDDARTIKLDPNGGTINNSAEPAVRQVERGAVIVGAQPVREGSKFIGWSDKNDGTGEVYTGALPVIEDTTFYAAWNPSVVPTEEAVSDESSLGGELTVTETADGVSIKGTGTVAPAIELGDLSITENTKTILLSINGSYSNISSDNSKNDIKLVFNAQNGDPCEIIIEENVSKKIDSAMLYVDLSGFEEFDGDISNVKLVFPEGTLTRLSVSEVTFTDNATAQNLEDAYYEELEKSNETATTGNTGSTDKKEFPIQPQDPVTKPSDNVSSDPFVAFTQNKNDIKFDFANEVDSAFFDSYANATLAGNVNGVATVTAEGADKTGAPAVFTPDNMEIDADDHRYVIVRARFDMGDSKQMKIYFNTAEDPSIAEARAVAMNFEANGRYETVVFNMSSNPNWKGDIKDMTFSFGEGAEGTCEFDYILFTKKVPAAVADTEKFNYVNKFSSATFKDINKSDWFYGDVEKSYKLGLMNGKGDKQFDPNGTMTVAEAITVAARIRAIYNGKTITAGTGADWYAPYVTYAINNSVIKYGEYTDFTAPATRLQVAKILAASIPDAWFNAVNAFEAIPDVSSSDPAFAQLLKLYNAGVIIGVDDAYNFNPDANIKRSEVSAIINRVVIKSSRIKVAA